MIFISILRLSTRAAVSKLCFKVLKKESNELPRDITRYTINIPTTGNNSPMINPKSDTLRFIAAKYSANIQVKKSFYQRWRVNIERITFVH